MDWEGLLIRWTIRVALIFYFLSITALLIYRRASRRCLMRRTRWAWTIGGIFYLLHVAAAFQFFHHWSHRHAYAYTAQRTEQVVGLAWGGGLYVNYAFTAAWILDIIWWWTDWRSYVKRPRWIGAALHAFMFFIVFNAIFFAIGPSLLHRLQLEHGVLLELEVFEPHFRGAAGVDLQAKLPRAGKRGILVIDAEVSVDGGAHFVTDCEHLI